MSASDVLDLSISITVYQASLVLGPHACLIAEPCTARCCPLVDTLLLTPNTTCQSVVVTRHCIKGRLHSMEHHMCGVELVMYTALSRILPCHVHCLVMYTALSCILPCHVHCFVMYTACIHNIACTMIWHVYAYCMYIACILPCHVHCLVC